MDEIIERLDRIERALSAHAANIDTIQVSALTGIATVTLERWRVDGAGPPYCKVRQADEVPTSRLGLFHGAAFGEVTKRPLHRNASWEISSHVQ